MNNKPFRILGIEHVGVAIKNRQNLNSIFSDILGLECLGSEEVLDQNVLTDIYRLGNSKIEFISSINDNKSIEKFINKRGEGLHHLALIVDNVKNALKYLDKMGIELIDKEPRIGAEGFSIAFLHPKSTNGILIELCEKK
tara:strand:+ start:702 stop:1121 length:420 start_codon:yes stop_codon:yes gene_type:complete